MSSTPKTRVAIIGRPNVGKSTLFNILTGTRKAVVKNQPGVTRDIQVDDVEWRGRRFELLDTGGVTEMPDLMSRLIREQVEDLLQTVDALVVVMDGRTGITPDDRDLFLIAEKSQKPYLIVVNKIDRIQEENVVAAEFYEFGRDVMPASFEQRRGTTEILEWVIQTFPTVEVETPKEGVTLAIIGKPNAGKSSLCNRLLGENRMIVSEIAGTTVDAIDSVLERNDKKYILIDTAGLRRKSKRTNEVEILATFKTRDAIKRADIVLMMVDGTLGVSEQDAKIAEQVLEDHKGLILVANKSDIGRDEIPEYRKGFRAGVEQVLRFFEDIPIVFASAKTGAGMDELFEKIDEVWEKLNRRISTSDLNDFFFDVIRKAPAPVYGAKDVKFYYLTQTNQVPPSFIAFANFPDGVGVNYRRFLARNLKDHFGLAGIPVRIFAMKSRGKGERDAGGHG